VSTHNGTLLSVKDVSVRFGGITALDHVSFDMEAGGVVGLIGPNGAGKTTLFNCLTRLYQVNEGDILFNGESLLSLAPHQIADRGIGRTFQNLALFSKMSVLENVLVGRHCQDRSDFVSNILRLPWTQREEEATFAAVNVLLELLELDTVRNMPVEGLTFATLKRVELARALASRPQLLLLDEPAGGLNHEEVDELANLIRLIRDEQKITVLLVEHHMNLVMEVSDKVVALDFGRKLCDGTPAQVQKNKDVIRAYLGTDE